MNSVRDVVVSSGIASLPVFQVPAAASANGPFLPLEESMAGELRFVAATLLAVVEKSFSALALSTDLASRLRAIGKAVATSFISRTIAWDS